MFPVTEKVTQRLMKKDLVQRRRAIIRFFLFFLVTLSHLCYMFFTISVREGGGKRQ
jgi:hypothetical protein